MALTRSQTKKFQELKEFKIIPPPETTVMKSYILVWTMKGLNSNGKLVYYRLTDNITTEGWIGNCYSYGFGLYAMIDQAQQLNLKNVMIKGFRFPVNDQLFKILNRWDEDVPEWDDFFSFSNQEESQEQLQKFIDYYMKHTIPPPQFASGPLPRK